ncbi:MAG: adenylyl-sulfate kinase [Sphingobacteriales bacterium]|jgi:adenylylsulfate kinase|nr:adenylyl-sulfate kinase [Sphingobacteriales bacterium]
MSTEQNPNVVRHHYQTKREDRERILNQRATIIWFTGLSGSGKSTLADAVERELQSRGYKTYLLDGDNLRHGLNADLDFSESGRQENIRRTGEVSALLFDAGLIVLTAFVSPYRSDRDKIRSLFPEGRFIEVFVDCPIEVCEQRDIKGLYAKARQGLIPDFTGVSAPYEPPLHPELTIHSHLHDEPACTQQVIQTCEPRLRHDTP